MFLVLAKTKLGASRGIKEEVEKAKYFTKCVCNKHAIVVRSYEYLRKEEWKIPTKI